MVGGAYRNTSGAHCSRSGFRSLEKEILAKHDRGLAGTGARQRGHEEARGNRRRGDCYINR